ncbi:hypothetical protein Acr_01g0010540 [Actinidia rufa]|uniref:VASt domain-containing protein n=1 Tax=Actinidia rufa TaxID=165716 RepID=A0A7J0E4D7_9ERIC|nr:hypothetical protein Acr_01g0010540 [Actinidia rufa]
MVCTRERERPGDAWGKGRGAVTDVEGGAMEKVEWKEMVVKKERRLLRWKMKLVAGSGLDGIWGLGFTARKDIRISEDYNLPPEAEVEIISSSGVQDYVEEDVAAVVNNDTSCSRKDWAWVEENSDAPEGAKCGSCQEVQKFRIYRNSRLVIETSQEINGVPYGDYFKVEGLWDVQRVDETSCIMNVYLNVAFSKKTMFKGKIVQGTIDEARDSYAIWIETVPIPFSCVFLEFAIYHSLTMHLRTHSSEYSFRHMSWWSKKNLAKDECRIVKVPIISGSPAADFSMNGQVPEDTQAKMVEPLEGSQEASDVKTSQILPDSKDVNQLIGHPLQGTLNGVSSLASLFRESMVKLYLSLKSQSQVPLLLVITFAMILLLMQVNIS